MTSVRRDEKYDDVKVFSNLVIPVYTTLPPPASITGLQGAVAYQLADDLPYYNDGIAWHGFQGAGGPQGFQGNQGNQGGLGAQGNPGFQGLPGPAGGSQGLQGVQGAPGFNGIQGTQGASNSNLVQELTFTTSPGTDQFVPAGATYVEAFVVGGGGGGGAGAHASTFSIGGGGGGSGYLAQGRFPVAPGNIYTVDVGLGGAGGLAGGPGNLGTASIFRIWETGMAIKGEGGRPGVGAGGVSGDFRGFGGDGYYGGGSGGITTPLPDFLVPSVPGNGYMSSFGALPPGLPVAVHGGNGASGAFVTTPANANGGSGGFVGFGGGIGGAVGGVFNGAAGGGGGGGSVGGNGGVPVSGAENGGVGGIGTGSGGGGGAGAEYTSGSGGDGNGGAGARGVVIVRFYA